MIRVDNDLRSKVDTIDSSNSVNQYLNIKLQEENNAEKLQLLQKRLIMIFIKL